MTPQAYTVENGRQILRFEGTRLAFSSSKTGGRARWIEFSLYRTEAGRYVISRVGRSLIYHGLECSVAKRSDNLQITSTVEDEAVPCPDCQPEYGTVFRPEKQRTYAAVCESAPGVLESLYQWDENSNRYLTFVARNLIESAAEVDAELASAYYEEHIL